MPKVSFRLTVVANNNNWPSLSAKVQAIREFFEPVCDLDITIEHSSLQPVFNTYPDLAPLQVVDYDWYDRNVSGPRSLTADIVLFLVAPQDHNGIVTTAGTMTQHNMGPWETTVFVGGENDRVYEKGQDVGDYFVIYACHEISHALYAMLGKRDDTHVHFPNTPQAAPLFPDDPNPQHALSDLDFTDLRQFIILDRLVALLQRAAIALSILQKQPIHVAVDQASPQIEPVPQVAPGAPKYDWSTPEAARHSLRVICDEEGLTVPQKDLMSRVDHCESGYNVKTVHPNLYNGKVASTDYGIAQWNDKYHGSEITPDEALHDPEKALRLQCQYVKAGRISQWVCYSSGLYLSYTP